jgi:hypothetical protein
VKRWEGDAGMDTRQVPDWYVEAIQMMGHADGVLRDLQFDLLDFMERQHPDWEVRRELERLAQALHGAAGMPALVEMAAHRVVHEQHKRTEPAKRGAESPRRAALG